MLLATATALVLLALPTRSVLWLSLASVSAIALSWAALRMMWTEVLESRRENAADRSAAAAAYRTLFSARVAEHAEFTTAMTERLAEAHLSRRELEGRVAQQERAGRGRRVRGSARRGGASMSWRRTLAVRAEQGDEVDELATWDSARPRPRLVREA